MRISTRKRGIPKRLQYCEIFSDNELNDIGDLVHFVLMVEHELVKMKEALSDSNWICTIKKELELTEKHKTYKLVDLPQRKKANWCKMDVQCEGKS